MTYEEATDLHPRFVCSERVCSGRVSVELATGEDLWMVTVPVSRQFSADDDQTVFL
jgi:hypothetical protein